MVPHPTAAKPGRQQFLIPGICPLRSAWVRSERPGFNRQCLTGVTWPAGMLTQATQSSPPLSRAPVPLDSSVAEIGSAGSTGKGPKERADSVVRRIAAGLAGPQTTKLKRTLPSQQPWGCSLPPSGGRAVAAGWKGTWARAIPHHQYNGAQGRQPLQKTNAAAAACARFVLASRGGQPGAMPHGLPE